MDINRRDFLQIAAALGILGATGGNNLFAGGHIEKERIKNFSFSDLMDFDSKGKATLLHICDMHAHIKPLYWREPSTLISAKNLVGTPGFICGDSFEKYYGIEPGSLDQYFDTYSNFETLAKKFGKMGGIAHIKPIVDHVKKERGEKNVLLLDSGDTWQGTAVALKTRGEAIVDAQNYLGVDVMVGHWEFTYGKERVQELIKMFKGEFISQNVIDNDPFSDNFEELIFPPYTIKEVGGAKIGIIGQSFPFTSTANPKKFTQGWSFALRHESLQKFVDELRQKKKVDCVVVLSHDGFSVDQELAKKVKGVDFILSGHTHDPSPKPIIVNDTVILIAGSHGKYVGRLDLDIKDKKVVDYSFKLIPVASNLIPADKVGEKLVRKWYEPYNKELNEVLGTTKGILYKRDTFYSTFDALIGQAIQDEMGSDIVFTPGYRWGTTLLPGDKILKDNVYEMTAITYPEVYTFELKGSIIANLMEDIADNVFNANPLLQQGGDMSRLTGASYSIKIDAPSGKRISDFKIGGKPLDLKKTYRVSSWGGNLQNAGENLDKKKIREVYEIVSDYIRKKKVIDISNKSNVTVLDFNCGCPKKGAKC
ncbi:MAG: thiosulfohydrolase SoxB [Sulfurovum sp.]|nr:thiosulfohydrolase SoxB [Sulfurovum sp.]MCB4744537.1 thiosulfohydrolase SoxB [Sulfurovum sp.]MCB4750285.1 thiosulfohydrolase SoxB [Sulfurovum sp.]MCB4754857.1 thiosulfohydrolase SoxB [Sulfurovum sp.]MCB4758371.1 thiosulfohydrolase SoxB [Sulfurovum sp.]